MTRLYGALLLLLLPVQAVALSCSPHNFERTYQEVGAAEESYVIVEGRLLLDANSIPDGSSRQTDDPAMTAVQGTLTGRSVSKKGFVTPFSKPVTVAVSCFASWCGTVSKEQQVVAFVRRDNGRYVIDVNPCGGHLFLHPDRGLLKRAVACFSGGRCQAD